MGANDKNQVDTKSLAQAQEKAQTSGIPQPVADGNGKIVYYVDADGAVVPQAIAEDRRGSAGLGSAPTKQSTDGRAPAAISDLDRQIGQEKTTGAAAAELAQYQATHAPVWVNGQQMVVTSLNPDGTPKTMAYLGRDAKGNPVGAASTLGGSSNPADVIDPTTGLPMAGGTTAFDALNVGANYGVLAGIKGSDQFTMASHVPIDVMSGLPVDPAQQATRPALGDHSAAANTQVGTSKMTIAEGVQWLARLSNQNSKAYDELVRQLRHAGYTGSQGEGLTGGAYSETVGMAFAKAAKDLSVMQQSTGTSMGLSDFLAQREQAVKDAAGASFQPDPRNYMDPGTLQATAKTAAEAAIGRNLTAGELAAFQQSFHNQQTDYFDQYDAAKKAQREAEAVGESAPGPNAVAPDAAGQAQALVLGDQYGQERANYSVDQYHDALSQLFGIK